MEPEIPLKEMVSFRALDAFLVKYKNNQQIYCQIFEKKQSMINLVAQQKMTPQIYKQLIEKAYQITKNPDIKAQLETDLFNLKEISNGDLNSWFEDCINDTGDLNDYEGQKAVFQKYKAELLSKNKSNSKVEMPAQQVKNIQSKRIQQKVQQKKQEPKVSNTSINTAQVANFLGMDTFMEKYKTNEEVYKKLLENKKKLLNFADNNKLNGIVYKGMIEKTNNNNAISQDIKNTIKLELNELQNKFKGNAQAWFKATIQMTKKNLIKQQDYLKQDKTPKKVEQPPINQYQKKQQTNPPPKLQDKSQIEFIMKNYFLSFRLLDNLLSKHEEDKDIFLQLYDRKTKLMEKVKSKALQGQMYLTLIKKSLQKCSHNEVRQQYTMDIEQLNLINGNKVQWLQNILDDTQFNFQTQKDMYQIHMGIKTTNKSPEKPPANEQLSYIKDIIQNNFCTFNVLDSLLQQYGQNKEIFCILFEEKQQLMKAIQSKTITGQNYEMLIKKSQAKCSNFLLTDFYDADILDLSLVHEDEHTPWLKSIIEKTAANFQQQLAKYNEYSKLFPKPQPIRASVSRQSVSRISIQRQSVQNVQTHEIDSLLHENFLTFRIIDSLLQKFQDDRVAFCKIFQEKKKLLEKIKSQQITAEKYEQLIKNAIKTCTKEELKEQYDMDLQNLTTISGGDHASWFEDLIDDTGFPYEAQQKKFKQYVKQAKKQTSKSSQIMVEVQYSVDDIVALTALQQLLIKRKDNKEYYTELKLKKKQIVSSIEKRQLGPYQYKQLLQNRVEVQTEPFLKKKIQQQLKKLKQQFNNDVTKWFIDIASNVDGISSSLLNRNITYEKLSFILKKLSQYQSVVVCYEKCKDSQERLADFNKNYYMPAKKKFNLIKNKIQKGQMNIDDLDPIVFCNKYIADVSFEMVNGTDKQSYKKELVGMLLKMNTTINQYNQYIKLLKRNSNKKNIQQTKKAIQQIQKDIAYIKEIAKSDQLIPKPIFQVEKIEKHNLDFFDMGDNQIHIEIHSIEGMSSKMTVKFYVIDSQHDRYQADVNNGNVNLQFAVILSERDMEKILKGQENHLLIKFIKKGWFSSSIACEQWVTLNFINNNVFEKKIQVGDIFVNLTAKVKKPKRLRPTIINGYKLIKFEPYEHSKFIENEFVKNMLPNQNPSPQSQISK